MKLVTFEVATPLGPVERLGAVRGETIVDLNLAAAHLYLRDHVAHPYARADLFVPADIIGLLNGGEESMLEARRALDAYPEVPIPPGYRSQWSGEEARLKAPLRPLSLRDFFAFEDHARAGAARRNEPMPMEWYDQPVYYKGNTREIYGPGETIPWPSFTRKLDFEFEIAAVIGKAGRDIPVADALKHVAGYVVMNDCSARDIQKNEMVCRMGPAKGKDFATVLGPWLVTADEWPTGEIPRLSVRVNGQEWSRSNGLQPYWNFSVMISHASQSETLLPGDLLGSGTYFQGCGLDMNRWVRPDDELELDAGPLGVLKNRIGSPQGETHLKYVRDGGYAK
ncbi:MAG: fumarylacetoacetate hydrolase family protein [Elusimicrobiota bacterium]